MTAFVNREAMQASGHRKQIVRIDLNAGDSGQNDEKQRTENSSRWDYCGGADYRSGFDGCGAGHG